MLQVWTGPEKPTDFVSALLNEVIITFWGSKSRSCQRMSSVSDLLTLKRVEVKLRKKIYLYFSEDQNFFSVHMMSGKALTGSEPRYNNKPNSVTTLAKLVEDSAHLKFICLPTYE